MNRDAIKQISEAGVELPIELVTEMDDIHQDFKETLAQIKSDAEAQKSERRKKRALSRYDKYVQTFDSMSTNAKLYVLEIMKTGQEKSQL